MPVLQPKITINLNDIIQLIAQLDRPELELFSQKVSLLFAERKITLLPEKEIELLKKANLRLSSLKQQQYNELAQKIQDKTASAEEQNLFLILNTEAEALNVERMKALVELSKTRKTNLDDLMLELGIN